MLASERRWLIPAKTFLLGEYAALTGHSAIILTTNPCFGMSLIDTPGLQGLHPQSPAGRFWLDQGIDDYGLSWSDPYDECGGLGASSAQFVAAWYAASSLHNKQGTLLDAYYDYCWSGQGLRPSGYDVIAQSQHQCVYINQQQQHHETFAWPFTELGFLLVHSGKKMATHHHLQAAQLPVSMNHLSLIVEKTKQAFRSQSSQGVINGINDYHKALSELGLVAEHTQQQIAAFKNRFPLSAIKGCGAMGADVLLLAGSPTLLRQVQQTLSEEGWRILATQQDIFEMPPIVSQECQT